VINLKIFLLKFSKVYGLH